LQATFFSSACGVSVFTRREDAMTNTNKQKKHLNREANTKRTQSHTKSMHTKSEKNTNSNASKELENKMEKIE
jgi:hypothetical protein